MIDIKPEPLQRHQVVSILNDALEMYRLDSIREYLKKPDANIEGIRYRMETDELVNDYLCENLK